MAKLKAASFVKLSILGTAVLFAGCQRAYPPMQAYNQMPQMQSNVGIQVPDFSNVAQTQYQQGQMQAPMMGGSLPAQQAVLVTTESDQRVSALTAELTELQDRLSRTERAMLRLDRRMQLVEANELSRMDGAQMSALEPTTRSVSMVGESVNSMPSHMQAQAQPVVPGLVGNQMSSAARMMPVSASYIQNVNPQGSGRSVLGLPSLADKRSAEVKGAPAELSVWTIRYQDKKIWPERAQLKTSRDVVTALRQENKPTAVYARGKNTSSKEFRERVRAVSRYLSKVSEKDQVPIAALSADHLDEDTIEIFTAN